MAILDNDAMKHAEWRKRLSDAVDESGRSKRAISLDSGNGPGYVHSILSEGKDPTIEKLLSVCDTLGVSAAYILHGVNVSALDQEILGILQGNPDRREAILALLSPTKNP